MTQYTFVRGITTWGDIPLDSAWFNYASMRVRGPGSEEHGWYYVSVPNNVTLTCSAQGYQSVSMNVGTAFLILWESMLYDYEIIQIQETCKGSICRPPQAMT